MIYKTPIIELKDVEFSYQNNPPLFKDLSFSFMEEKFYVIKGQSGIGKTSFLRLINRLEEPFKGEIRFKNTPYSEFIPPQLRKKIIHIHQTPVAINGSVKHNLIFPFSFKNNQKIKKPDDKQLLSYLDTFMLKNIPLDKNAQDLSVGQLQRICFIRGLLLDPEVILLDEPTSALDEESSKIVEQSAENFSTNPGKTVIMVSHKTFTPLHITPIFVHIKNGKIEVT